MPSTEPLRPPPATLTPPTGHPAGHQQRPGGRWPWIALLLLLAVAAASLLLLPPATRPPPAPQPAAAAPHPSDDLQAQAESLLVQLLQRRAQLENANVTGWASEPFTSILQQIEQADALFAAADPVAAISRYRTAADQLDALYASRDERFSSAMQLGRQALDAGDGKGALEHYRIALALQPDHHDAQRGLARAQTLDEVIRLTNEASAALQQGYLQQALDGYRQALQIDAEYAAAAAGLQRAQTALQERDYQDAMSRLLEAIERGDLAAANAALTAARKLQPDTPELKDAASRLALLTRSTRLLALSTQARRAVQQEQWTQALKIYQQALQIDPAATFALAGQARAEQRRELQQQIERYLQQPQRLQSPQPMANARLLLQRLDLIDDPGPRLRDARDRLTALVEQMQQRLKLHILSDGMTEITIYRVGRLGRFSERTLELPPGSYTVVGSCEGFRDVRRKVTLTAGSERQINVRCEERI